ncbi:hypothetical protein GGD54_001265 [Rhizobium tropici]|uniref:Uncharacterized protein n=1 Tax=Rhizobium tropici TaxID=398 RepID=A0ABR6QW08_RHITR|nr:hypothetical protein [Rhizobium tropici]MBB5592039.1 hypothetical protein [Rhizobium tropici]MBB6491093.1 hypothetical protein [Rhizobium tropici]
MANVSAPSHYEQTAEFIEAGLQNSDASGTALPD